MAWNCILDPESTAPVALLRECFWDESQLEIYGFPELQRAYLGLSGKLFSSVLSTTPRSEIDQTDRNGKTLLSWAAMFGDHRTTETLLLYGANPESLDRAGLNSLHYAISGRNTTCIRHLLNAKTSIEARDPRGQTPLMRAALYDNQTSLELLIARGADINARGPGGSTALHCAAFDDENKNLAILIDHGADINAETPDGLTALTMAISENSYDSLKLLLGCPELRPSPYALWKAAVYGNIETLTILHEAHIDIPDFHRRCSEMELPPLRVAWVRRQDNEFWAQHLARRDPDRDPEAWFDAFAALYRGILARSEKMSESQMLQDRNFISILKRIAAGEDDSSVGPQS